MSLPRSLLAAIVALAIAAPVFADDSNPVDATPDNTSATSTVDTQTTADSAISTKVDLNKATVKDLMKLKGMNASRARAVIAYRKKHGDFTTTDTLAKVHGFGKLKAKTLETIKSQLSID